VGAEELRFRARQGRQGKNKEGGTSTGGKAALCPDGPTPVKGKRHRSGKLESKSVLNREKGRKSILGKK